MTIPSRAPIVQPDLSQPTVNNAVTQTLEATGPFLPAKVRAAIYVAAPVVGIVCLALAPVFGGTIGDALTGIGSAATAAGGVTALAHVN